MGIVLGLVYIALLLFFVALIIRLVYDWVQMFARSWRPRGLALVTAHAVYSVTDKPLKLLRRLIPPLRLGGMSLDIGFLLLFVAVSVAMWVVKGLVYAQPIAAWAAAAAGQRPARAQAQTERKLRFDTAVLN